VHYSASFGAFTSFAVARILLDGAGALFALYFVLSVWVVLYGSMLRARDRAALTRKVVRMHRQPRRLRAQILT
jgi:uncharacterized protein (DUF58 family)